MVHVQYDDRRQRQMPVQLRPVSNTTTERNVPIGDYRVRLRDIVLDEGNANSMYPKSEPDLKWILEIRAVEDAEDDSEDGDPEEWVTKDLWLYTGQSMGVRRDGAPTKGREAAEAFEGRRYEEDEVPDTDTLIGREAIATVGRSQNNRTKVTRMRRLPRRAQNGNAAQKRQANAAETDDSEPWDQDE